MLPETLESIPKNPGVYLMKDKEGRTIYIGKAMNLRRRVNSYFSKSVKDIKTETMAKHVESIEFIVTDSETEAIVLEDSLIKKTHPKYNILLKDDKAYPYIRLTMEDEYPRILLSRRAQENRKSAYFGPYTSSVISLIKALEATFKIRDCPSGNPAKLPKRKPCILYETGNCLAPCADYITKEEYHLLVRDALDFLCGKSDRLLVMLGKRMKKAAEARAFERAASLRDQIRKINDFRSRQKIVSSPDKNRDVIGFAANGRQICIALFFVRAGAVTGSRSFVFNLTETKRNTVASFVKQFYAEQKTSPREIILQEEIEDARAIESWLNDLYKRKIEIKVPQKGELKKLVALVSKNAQISLQQHRITHLRAKEALVELKKELHLEKIPQRIEAFDISNIQGKQATGSMVAFVAGRPEKSGYRRFRIKAVEGQDDFAMMGEVVLRRYRRALKEGLQLPDLILVDGGKGQLGAALDSLGALNLDIPACALAKKEEEIFLPGKATPVILGRESQALYLVQRIRDEAHRFAVAYHRKLREKDLFSD